MISLADSVLATVFSAVVAVFFLHVIGRHRTPERIVERAVPAAPVAPAPAHVGEAGRVVRRREGRVQHLRGHVDGREAHRYLQRGRLRRLVEAEAGELGAHEVFVALQLQRVVLRRRRLERIALVGQLGGPLVEGGDVTADRRRAAYTLSLHDALPIYRKSVV